MNPLGPGEYLDINDFGKDSIKISIHPKPLNTQANLNPGPGSYNPNYSQIEDAVRNTKISPERSGSRHGDVSPGPGTYDYTLDNIGKDCISYSLQYSNRKTQANHNPGPGTYEPNVAPTRERSPEYTIG